MIVILLGLVLVITVPLIVFLNRMAGLHQMSSSRRQRGHAICEEGIAYANQILSANQATWNAAIAALPTYPLDCNNVTPIPASSGGHFTITCDQNNSTFPSTPQRQPFQVHVIVVALLPGNSATEVPTRAVEAYFSQRSAGVKLATGLSASAALQVVLQPSGIGGTALPANSLMVHWGPIVSFDPTAWGLVNPLDTVTIAGNLVQGYPRKFSQGGIYGTDPSVATANFPRIQVWTNSAQTSDQKEFWAFASQVFPPPIDDSNASVTGYVVTANAEGQGANPHMPAVGGTTQNPAFSGHYVITVPGTTVTFDPTAGFTIPPFYTNPVIFVEGAGNVEWDHFSNDFGQTGAFIILSNGVPGVGNLTLNTVTIGTALDLNLNFPVSAAKEYGYIGSGWAPCNATTPGGTCNSLTIAPKIINFRGFLDVKGNITVSGGNVWNLAGVVNVGDISQNPPTGNLQIANTGTLTLYYDEKINHNILVTNVELQKDLLQDIPTP